MKLQGRRKSDNVIDKTGDIKGRIHANFGLGAQNNKSLRDKTPIKDRKDNRSDLEKFMNNPAVTKATTGKSSDIRSDFAKDPAPGKFSKKSPKSGRKSFFEPKPYKG